MTNPEAQQTRNVFVGIDIQNDFIDGSLAVNEGAEVVAPANTLSAEVRDDGGTVVWSRDWHPKETPHFDAWPVHCVQETRGAAFSADLDVRETDIVLSKGMGQTDGYSAMEGVGPAGQTLESIISPESDERVRAIMLGLATDYCVRSTVLDSCVTFGDNPDVDIIIVRDGIRAVNIEPDDEQRAMQAMEEAGAIAMTSEEIRRAFF